MRLGYITGSCLLHQAFGMLVASFRVVFFVRTQSHGVMRYSALDRSLGTRAKEVGSGGGMVQPSDLIHTQIWTNRAGVTAGSTHTDRHY